MSEVTMITFKTGDLFNEDVEAIVNTVNCVGVMGRGLALQFKKRYPDNFKQYAAACDRNEVRTGSMFVVETGQLVNPRFVVNFPTKSHWRAKSRIEDIEDGLAELALVIRDRGIRSIAVPPLGAGLGGLKWPDVKQRIVQALGDLEGVNVVVFQPHTSETAQPEMRSLTKPKMTRGRAALIALMRQYLDGLLDPFVSLLELHKLMYFMQVSGEPLRLKYQKAHYGPYAENLRHVLHAIEGHYTRGYRDGGDAPEKTLEIVDGALQEARLFLAEQHATRAHIERVSQLVDGFESPFGLELLSTVHWVATHERPETTEAVVTAVHAWSERKKQFTPRQIRLALARLDDQGWCAVGQ